MFRRDKEINQKINLLLKNQECAIKTNRKLMMKELSKMEKTMHEIIKKEVEKQLNSNKV